jgi:hypothetical protein
MPGVFISYRRHDSAGHAGRLFDHLERRYGRNRVFMDVAHLSPGVDFAREIEEAVAGCDALLAVIGPDWLTCADDRGHPRLDDPHDFVRLEIAAALKRGVRVVPVLVGGAGLPLPERLPDDLRALAGRQTIELRDARWDVDANELMAALDTLVERPLAHPSPARVWKVVGLIGAAAALIAIVVQAARYVSYAKAAAPPPTSTAVAPERVLEYAITIRPQAQPQAVPVRVTSDRIFSPADLIRLSFRSPQPGFLYVVNETPAESDRRSTFNILFPSPTSNGGSARLREGEELFIPERGDGFRFDDRDATEKLWLVWAAAHVETLDALKRWANPHDKGEIKDEKDVDAVRALLAAWTSSRPEVAESSDGTQVTVKVHGDVLVKLVSLQHRR